MKRRSFIASLFAASAAPVVAKAIPATVKRALVFPRKNGKSAVMAEMYSAQSQSEDPIILTGRIELKARPTPDIDVYSFEYPLRPAIRPLPRLTLTVHGIGPYERGRVARALCELNTERFTARPEGSGFEFQFSGIVTMTNDGLRQPFVFEVQIIGAPMNAVPRLAFDAVRG